MAQSTSKVGRQASAGWLGALAALRQDMRGQAATPWTPWLAVTVAALWGVGAVVLGFMSVAAHQYPTFPYDVPVSTWIQHLRGTFAAQVINFGGDLQSQVPAVIALVLIYGLLLLGRFFLEAVCSAVSGFGADGVHLVLNSLVARPRPHGNHIEPTLANLGQLSYPSGHAAHTLGLYGFLFFLCVLAERAPSLSPRWRPWLIVFQVICVYFILAVGVSRVLEGLHWPSDVLAGYLIGALCLVLGIALYHRLAPRWSQLTARFAPRSSRVAAQ